MGEGTIDGKRRALLIGGAAVTAAYCGGVLAQPVVASLPQPPADRLEAGDLLWPKTPGAFVPYNTDDTAGYEQEKREWIDSKRKFVAGVKANPSATPEMRRLAATLEDMEFREFQSLYLGDVPPNQPDQYGTDQAIYVGHIGLVEMTGQGPMVVEALMKKGVVRSSYAEWLAARKGQIVWHARLRDRHGADRARIAQAAALQVGKPYDFWNFDLANTSGFYCSKLVWHSVMDVFKVALDDNPNPARNFWYSPKQVMKSKHIYFLNNPGSYTWK